MEEALANANRIVDQLLRHDQKVALQQILPLVKGVALVTELAEKEMTVRGSESNGILIARRSATGKKEKPDLHDEGGGASLEWSDPYGCKLAGTGWGIGGARKDIVVFILDEESMETLSESPTGLELSGGASLVMGCLKNEKSNEKSNHFVSKSDAGLGLVSDFLTDDNAGTNSNKGVGTLSIAFTQGTYVSATANGAIILPSEKLNRDFYGQDVSIDNMFESPGLGHLVDRSHKVYSDIQDLYQKLNDLSQGRTSEQTEEVPREAPEAIADIVRETVATH